MIAAFAVNTAACTYSAHHAWRVLRFWTLLLHSL